MPYLSALSCENVVARSILSMQNPAVCHLIRLFRIVIHDYIFLVFNAHGKTSGLFIQEMEPLMRKQGDELVNEIGGIFVFKIEGSTFTIGE